MGLKVTPSGAPEDQAIKCETPKEAATVARNINAMKDPLPDGADALLKKYPLLGEVINDSSLSPFQKKLKIRPVFNQLRDKQVSLRKEVSYIKEAEAFYTGFLDMAEQYAVWKKVEPRLEKNDCSRLHGLIGFLKKQLFYTEALEKHGALPADKNPMRGTDPNKFPWGEIVPFVVEHDWASAFKNATDYNDGTYNLPYEMCAFEFRISGQACLVLSDQLDKDLPPKHRFYSCFGEYWASEDEDKEQPLAFAFAKSQIKAICVALDAEVATRHVERVKESVNRKRIEEGREPFYSYHIVRLNRQFRVANPSSGGGTQGKKRLHFRRGHWRHFAEFKTWVRWTLVGNPELGFIDKEYRL